MPYTLELTYADNPTEIIPVDGIAEARKRYWEEGEKLYKYKAIVKDEQGMIVAEFFTPYEGITINPYAPDALSDIQADYNISDDLFRRMVEQWLKNNPVDE
jgi:hypothetical protein